MNTSGNRGVVFMCFGSKHNSHMCIAFSSLRDHWKGQVAIICDPANEPNMRVIADEDPEKKTQIVTFDPHGRRSHGSGASYLNKCKLIELMPFMHSVFIDCDCVVVGDFSCMFPADVEVRLTQFSDWVTTGKKMSKRLDDWQEVKPDQVALQKTIGYPALNTGVMGLSKLSKKLSDHWYQTCEKNVRFMCDELAMQLIFLDHPHAVFPDYLNCSPIYSPGREGFDESKVRIWHGHGFKTIRSAKGLSVWLPQLIGMIEDDKFGIKAAMQTNKYFRRLAADPIGHIKQYAEATHQEITESNNITADTFKS